MARLQLTDSPNRRAVLAGMGTATIGALAGCTGGISGDGGSADFPQDDIRLIIPYGTAGGYNAYARMVAKYLEQHLPNEVSVNPDNIQGGGGRTATNTMYTSDPDGYTQMIVNINSFTRQQLVFDTEYDVTDTTYFAQVANSPQAMAVSTETGIESWSEFVDQAASGDITWAGEGRGSTSSLLGKVIGEVTGEYDFRDTRTVQFDGKSGVVASMKRGETDAIGNPWDSLLTFVREGTMRFLLFIGNEAPDAILEEQPDIETLSDLDYDDDTTDQLAALAHSRLFGGPPGIPDDVTSTIRDAYDEAINDDEFRSEAEEADRPIDFRPGEEVQDVVQTKFETWEPRQDMLEEAMT